VLVKVYHNGDDVFIAWKADGPIDDCRGFALMRRRNGLEEVVSTWVGFAGQRHKQGERRASTNWPIQRYQWTDYMANPGDRLQYRVVPMVGPDKDNLRADGAAASDWTAEITLDHVAAPGIEVLFNRGIVAAQWVSRRLGITAGDIKTKELTTVIETPGDPMRTFLAGPLGARLFELLGQASAETRDVYAALYELDDEQLEAALEKFGQHAHVVLGNGSVKKKGEDQNSDARARLAGTIDLHNRMTSPRALAHNKFLVICDDAGAPRWVWTGSQNWTKTGLCTQANNSVLIDDPELAGIYKGHWDDLRAAADTTPQTLKDSNTAPQQLHIGAAPTTLWFTPTVGRVDLADARTYIDSAEQAILFLMFNPGPADTLLNQIIKKARTGVAGRRLYIKGAINQDPSTAATNVQLFDQANIDRADFDVVLPAAIDVATSWFAREMKKLPTAFAMVHSKVVLVDPFGPHPVLMTGSHNLGPKASGTNDENLLIIRDAPGLASAYATNIMSVYNQYRWRFNRLKKVPSTSWDGLKDNTSWQPWHWSPAARDRSFREIDFWMGV